MKLRRILIWIIAGSLVLGVGLFGAGLYLFNSSAGAQWAVNKLINASDVDIRIEGLQGTLRQGLTIDRLVYRDAGQQIEADRLQLGVRWSALTGRVVELSRVDVLDARYLDTDPAASREAFQLSLPELPVDLCIKNGEIGRVQIGEGTESVELKAISIEIACMDRKDHSLTVGHTQLETQGVSLTLDDLQAKLSARVPLDVRMAWSYNGDEWQGSGPVFGDLPQLEFDQSVSGPWPFSAQGSIEPLSEGAPLINARVRWADWQAGEIMLPSGEAHATGTLEAYTLEYQFALVLPDATPANITGSGTGNLEGMSTVDARLSSAIAELRYRGMIDWQQEIVALGALRVDRFDPAWLHETLSGELKGDAGLSLNGLEQLEFTAIKLSGLLNDQSLKASGGARIHGSEILCTGCLVSSGDSHVLLDGSIDNGSLNAVLEVHAPDLKDLWPGAGGRLNAQGRLAGTLTTPVFSGRLGGRDLSWATWSLDRLNINSKAVAAEEIDLSLLAEGLVFDGGNPSSVTATAIGNIENMQLALQWQAQDMQATAELDIERQGSEITGLVRQVRFVESFSGSWQLASPFSFRAGQSGVNADAHQWVNDASRIEVETLDINEGNARLKAEIVALPLAMFNSLLPEHQKLDGLGSARLDLEYRDEKLQGHIDWQQQSTRLTVRAIANETAEIIIPLAEASLHFENGGVRGKARLLIEPNVTSELDLVADGLSGEAGIEGKLKLQGSDWDWITAVVPDIDHLVGDINADLDLSGRLLTPEVRGDVRWTRGSVQVPIFNVFLTDVEMTASGARGGAATVQGKANSGSGSLQIEGRIGDIMAPMDAAEFVISGDGAEVLNWPEYQVWLSPEVTIRAAPDGWTLGGRLHIPKAEIIVRELPPETVTPSEDVRVLGAEQQATRPTRYSGEAQLTLGEQVHVNVFGLDTRLTGDMQVRLPAGRAPVINGQVSLVGGTFVAYGQKLEIEQGTLLFTGNPENPVVDVKATRTIETFDGTVVAGIHLQGRAQNLRSRIYSTPAMAEADALSYLVIGRPLSQASATEGGEVSNAAFALGLGQASRITQQIGNTLGLDQLSMVGSGGESTALVAGKQINKRLYARYAYGVFSRIGTLLLRYKLSKRLVLEAAAGERQSIDILYSVEKQ